MSPRGGGSRRWEPVDDRRLRELVDSGAPKEQVAAGLGRSEESIKNRAYRPKLSFKARKKLPDEQKARL